MLYCPRCKSDQIFPVVGGYVGQVYLCKKCGYRGSFVLEADPGDIAENSGDEGNGENGEPEDPEEIEEPEDPEEGEEIGENSK